MIKMIKNLFGNNSPQHWWSNDFSNEEFEVFLNQITDYFTEKSKEITIYAEEGYLTIDGDSGQYGIQNLADNYRASDEADRKEVVQEHFDRIELMHKNKAKLDAEVEDYNAAKKYLKVKLYDQSYFNHKPDAIITRNDFDGVKTVLVFDFPDAVQNVNPELIEKWKKPLKELFDYALKNTLTEEAGEFVEQEFQDFKALICEGESFFTTTHALDLQSHPECIGAYGSIVAIPNRHTMLCHPFESTDAVVAIGKIIQLNHIINAQGPGPIGDHVYYYKDENFVKIGQKIDEKSGTLSVIPPNELVEALNKAAENKEK
jgi:hypothetical protein